MKLQTPKIFTFLILYALIFSSCSLKKRLYTKGFYTSSAQSIKKPNGCDTVAPLPYLESIKQLKKENYPILLAQLSKSFVTKNKINYSTTQCLISNCDTIILKSGAKLIGTITEVNNKKIFFRNCDSGSYFIFTINKTDVAQINFANGNKGLTNFKTANAPRPINQKWLNPTSLIGFIFSLFTIVSFAILSLSKSLNLGIAILLLLITFVLWLISFILCTMALIQTAYSDNKSKASFLLASFGLLSCLVILFFTLHLY